jgi:hypothetical protein
MVVRAGRDRPRERSGSGHKTLPPRVGPSPTGGASVASSSLLGVELTRRRRPVDMLAVRLMSTGLVVTLFSLVGTIVVGIAIWRFFPR